MVRIRLLQWPEKHDATRWFYKRTILDCDDSDMVYVRTVGSGSSELSDDGGHVRWSELIRATVTEPVTFDLVEVHAHHHIGMPNLSLVIGDGPETALTNWHAFDGNVLRIIP